MLYEFNGVVYYLVGHGLYRVDGDELILMKEK